MIILVILASLLSAARAKFALLTDVPGVPVKPWTGPVADHQLGIHPPNTPEVAAAKAQHLKTYREVLAVLPELSPEERYPKQEAVIAFQKEAHDQLREAQSPHPVVIPVIPRIQKVGQGLTTTGPIILAEDVPRSPTGEVPEVFAARLAHLKALKDARAASIGRL